MYETPQYAVYDLKVIGDVSSTLSLLSQSDNVVGMVYKEGIHDKYNLEYLDSALALDTLIDVYHWNQISIQALDSLYSQDELNRDSYQERGHFRIHLNHTSYNTILNDPNISGFSIVEDKIQLLSNPLELTRVKHLQAPLDLNLSTAYGVIPGPNWFEQFKGGETVYTGKGIKVGVGYERVCDHSTFVGDSDSLYRFEGTRIYWSGNCPSDWYHGTHVAGIIAGNGYQSRLNNRYPSLTPFEYRGIAPEASVESSRIASGNHTIRSVDTFHVENRSYTQGRNYYNDRSQQTDEELASHNSPRTFPIVVDAVGNNGFTNDRGTPDGFGAGYYSMTNHAKNSIKVCNTYNDRPIRAYPSSMGPTEDGRMGPDICAPGSGTSRREMFNIKIDYIRIKGSNGTNKVAFEFNDSNEEWFFTGSENVIEEGKKRNGQPSLPSIDNGDLILREMRPYVGSFKLPSNLSPAYTRADDDTLEIKYVAYDKLYNFRQDPDGFLPNFYLEMSDDVTSSFVKIPLKLSLSNDYTNDLMTTLKIPLSDSQTLIQGYETQNASDGFTNMGLIINELTFQVRSSHLGIMSAAVDGNYTHAEGTSQAAPHVTGIVALMLQKQRDELLGPNQTITHDKMWASTARGILTHTATDMVSTDYYGLDGQEVLFFEKFVPNPDLAPCPGGDLTKCDYRNAAYFYDEGPDWATGYGMVNAEKAVEYVSNDHYLQSSISEFELKRYTFYNDEPGRDIRVSLAWDDPAAVGLNPLTETARAVMSKKLVNDLDIYVYNAHQKKAYAPWVLDPNKLGGFDGSYEVPEELITASGVIDSKATKGINWRDNIEVVDIEDADIGYYTIVIKGTQFGSTSNLQDFSLIYDIKPSPSETKVSDEILSFELPASWYPSKYGSKILIEERPNTDGHALAIYPKQQYGYWTSDITSTGLIQGPLAQSFSRARVKMRITKQGNKSPHYEGNVQLYLVDGPLYAQTKNREYMGQVELMSLTLGEYQELELEIPEYLIPRLKDDKEIRLSLLGSFNNPREGDVYLIDWIKFEEIEEPSNTFNCSTYSNWQSNTHVGGDYIQYENEVYYCKEGVTSPWCLLSGYQPGSTYWAQAWEKVGVCAE